VHEDFETYGAAVGLSTVCVYGGAPMQNQEYALRRGVDVVVGTPGRVKDFVERGSLNMSNLRFRVLDEADEMLNMGARARAPVCRCVLAQQPGETMPHTPHTPAAYTPLLAPPRLCG
jgi:superfamily II DNA/RNA helicase